ncbi:hypothetical protein [Pseudomonas sp. PDM16]|nr:hypothetical protein [Pseudomonas sp. PDM16]
MRTLSDIVFIIGALAMTWQVVSGFFSPVAKPVPQSAEGGAPTVG